MNRVSDLGVLTGAFHLEALLSQDALTSPVQLPDGSTMFVWRGSAERVELLTWMPAFPPVPPYTRLGGSDLWILVIDLPHTAMIEYRIGVSRRGGLQSIIDPLNDQITTNPFGTNSVAHGPAYRVPPWTEIDEHTPTGSLSEIRVSSDVWNERRHHSLYVPNVENLDTDRILVVHDGPDFLNHSRLAIVLDNLIASGDIPPIPAILHHPKRRLTEYANDERHSTHVIDELIPHVQRRLDMSTPPQLIPVGSSLGAVAALSVAWRYPERTNGVALLSGSFARRVSEEQPDSIFAPIVDFVSGLDEDRLADKPIYVSCGRYEGLIDLNRSLVPRLRSGGARVRYDETWDGHQWASWRDRLGPALAHVTG